MLRITTTTESGSQTLKLEGRIGGPWVDELRETWSAVAELSGPKSVSIDMRGVSYVDRRGAEFLLQMEGEGASLLRCSDFIRQLLQANSESKEAARRSTKRTKKESEHASTLRP